MSHKNSKLDWLGSTATVLSLLTCYGTIAIIGILGALGIAIVLNEAIWAGAIITFASLAVVGFGFGLVRHGQPWPVLIGGLGVGILSYTMYIQYNRLTELVGFIFLSLAAFWEWRIRYRITKC